MIINKSQAPILTAVAAVQSDTDDLQTQVGVAGAGLSAIPDMATNTDLDALIATVGVAGAGLSAIPDMATNTDLDALIATVGVAGAGLSAIPDMATATAQGNQALEATLGAPAGASVSADIAAVKAVVDAINPEAATADKADFSYLIAGGEQVVYTNSPGADKRLVQGMWLDLSAAAQDGTIRCYYKVKSTYRLFSSEPFVASGSDDAVYLDFNMGIDNDLKVTYEAAVAEAITISYDVLWQKIG